MHPAPPPRLNTDPTAGGFWPGRRLPDEPIGRTQVPQEQGLPSHVCWRQALFIFSTWQHKKQQNSGFFQAFPWPSVKCILQKAAGSSLTGGVSAAAPSPGQPAGIAAVSRRWRRTLGRYEAGDLSLGRRSLLALPLPYSSTRSPRRPGARSSRGGRPPRWLACRLNPWVCQLDFHWSPVLIFAFCSAPIWEFVC